MSMTLTHIVLELLLQRGWLVAHVIIGLGLTADIGGIASCLFLEGACREFGTLGCLHIHYLLRLAALQASACLGQAGCVLIVLMRCMLSLSLTQSVVLCNL